MKNVILFIGDGMPQSAVSLAMILAIDLIWARKQIVVVGGSFRQLMWDETCVDYGGEVARPQADQRKVPVHRESQVSLDRHVSVLC